MNAIRMAIVLSLTIASVTFGSGRQIEIKNRYNIPWPLSDLYLYFADGEFAAVRLANASVDDELIPAQGTRILPLTPTSRAIVSYTISSATGTGANYVEWETWAFNITKLVPRKLSFFSENGTNRPLVASVDDSIAPNTDLTNGTAFTFVNGVSDSLPGWTMSNNFNFEAGQPLNPFSGTAIVYETPFEATVIPEPAMLCAAVMVLFAVSGRLRRSPVMRTPL